MVQHHCCRCCPRWAVDSSMVCTAGLARGGQPRLGGVFMGCGANGGLALVTKCGCCQTAADRPTFPRFDALVCEWPGGVMGGNVARHSSTLLGVFGPGLVLVEEDLFDFAGLVSSPDYWSSSTVGRDPVAARTKNSRQSLSVTMRA